jgi:hypothetical protein
MQPKPALSRKLGLIYAIVAIGSSGAVLFLSTIPARLCPESPKQAVAALSNGERLQAMLDEGRRPGADFRLRLEQRLRPHVAAPNDVSIERADDDERDAPVSMVSIETSALQDVC